MRGGRGRGRGGGRGGRGGGRGGYDMGPPSTGEWPYFCFNSLVVRLFLM